MEREEFVRTAVKRGYCRKPIGDVYVKNNPKEKYTEDDLIELYRFANREPIRSKVIRMAVFDEELFKQKPWV